MRKKLYNNITHASGEYQLVWKFIKEQKIKLFEMILFGFILLYGIVVTEGTSWTGYDCYRLLSF